MVFVLPLSDFQTRVAIQIASVVRDLNPTRPGIRMKAVIGTRAAEKPAICTADELHFVHVPSSNWRLALWRYKPSTQGTRRNHPLLLLSGLGTNAIGYDLAPDSSFARYMCNQGFDTWILELRGAGLSAEYNLREANQPLITASDPRDSTTNHETNDGGIIASHFVGLQERFSTSIVDFQKQVDLVLKYRWDFDHYLEEDVPAAMEYIRNHCRPDDGKLLAIGHSMGGILLYAILSKNGHKGKNSGLAAVVTLGSSLDYTTSRSSLKFLLPLVDPARALNVPVIPLGALSAALHPVASRPYFFLWLKSQVSAQNMMHPELFEKLMLNNFCTIPAKLFLQLSTAFQKGGLCNRNGTFYYKEHLKKSNIPVLALAGDQDLICPPEAVYETVKMIPRHSASFKVFGEPRGPHYAHYDIVGGRLASHHVYPCVVEFLSRHDQA
ncbi:uncharacterized protein LOC111402347 [Olea europaea var. sylvestris]|uniref:uncharacterized protein LOC111402347 n=1 Tax=Olea europaea var. sylvestris TaxID=158386 RepID=UPI000C1D63E0|nr:uncharacterized protein LOC111402347 [Olea europaea var. sylvestris]